LGSAAKVVPQSSFKTWLGSVDDYWFGRGSPTALGVLRICTGSLAVATLVMLGTSFSSWFGEKSFVPLSASQRYLDPLPHGIPRLNLLGQVSAYPVLFGFYIVVLLAAIFTTIGLWTKISSIALALGIVSLNHRNGVVLHGGDTVLRISVLYLALSPCGRACSVDRLWKLWKGKEGPEAPQVSLWGQKLIQYNVALLYFATFWLKFGQGSYWRNLTATYYTSHLNEFHRFWVPEFINRPPFVYLTTLMTLVIELSLATLVFYKPARKWVLLSGLFLHGFIEYSMNIPLFGWLVCSLYLSFYTGEEVAGFFKRLGGRFKKFAVAVPVPAGMSLRPGPANVLAAVDPLGLVTYTQGSEPAFAPSDVKRSWTRSLGSWPFAWIPGVWRRLLAKSLQPSREDPPAATGKTARKKVAHT
jgi:hypothetical protein